MAKRVVKIFLDSNVILSGLISDKGAPRIILDILSLNLPFLKGVTGEYNLIEIERNMKKKIPQALPVYKKYLSKLNLEIIPIPSYEEIKKFSEYISGKDIPVVVSAIKGKVDFLITGDKKHFESLKRKRDFPVKILDPSEFCGEILSKIIEEFKKFKR